MLRIVVRIYVVLAAASLAIGVALDDSFFAHFESSYAYTTPVAYKDVWRVLAAFRIADIRFVGWLVPAVALSAITAVLLLIGKASPRVRLLVSAPQLLLLLFAPIGMAAFPSDLLHLAGGYLDGEWFQEGWPVIESCTIWVVVPAVTFGNAAWRLCHQRT
jgi:hypothetical protein